MSLPAHKFVNVVYAWATKDASEEELERFNYLLIEPLPGQEMKETPEIMEAEGSMFMNAMTMFGG